MNASISIIIALMALTTFGSSIPEVSSGLIARQDENLPSCRLEYKTDVWTDCIDVLAQFQLTLEQFLYANPGLGAGCDGFNPGATYCVYRPSNNRTISKDGSCGHQSNWTVSCVGSKFGDCCKSNGKCGSGEDYCGKGNCQEGDCDGGIPYSPDGKCGRDFNYLPCPSKFGLCCGANGQCGNSTAFCTTGCQSGPCLESSTTKPTSQTSAPTPTTTPGSVSLDGTCGYIDAFTCKGSKFGKCCSAAGYCGDTEYECSQYLGCQPDFGLCNQTAAITAAALVLSDTN